MVTVRVQNRPHCGSGESPHFLMFLQGGGDSGGQEVFLLTGIFKSTRNFFDLHRLTITWNLEKLNFGRQWDWFFKFVFDVPLSLISPSTKCDLPTPLPSYTSSHSRMTLKILE